MKIIEAGQDMHSVKLLAVTAITALLVAAPGNSNAASPEYKTVTKECTAINTGFAKMKVKAQIRVGSYPGTSWRWIDSASTSVTLTGLTVGLQLSNEKSDHKISGNKVDFWGNGTVNGGVFVPNIGGIVIVSQNGSCSGSYQL